MIDNNIKYRSIHRLLIANRGEIAVRIIKTAKAMGITTIGIVTTDEPYTIADEQIFIEGDTLADTYLNVDAIIKAAATKQADAIHPGYGFLSENPALALAVEKAGLIFIGPNAKVIQKVGDKVSARQLAQSLDIPVTKGFHGTTEELYKHRETTPYPVLIKAAAGGGGKGMSIVNNAEELRTKLKQAEREAERYFGDKTLLMEQYLKQPRHIEVQVLADKHGNCIHLFERECSIQRRYQKIIEEAPSSFVNDTLRSKLTTDAIKLCAKIGYENAGTVEFLVDTQGNHYFLEVNARIQVEHPVTEMITSIDIVKEQLHIAMGLPLMVSQNDITINGHALECRIYAEDPQNNFQPAPGKILSVQWPQKSLARTEKWFDEPIEILPDFDPMLAKIITHAPTRHHAIDKMKRALQSTLLMGSTNNIAYLKNILANDDFNEGNFDTAFCDNFTPPTPLNTNIESVVAASLIWQFQVSSDKTNSLWQEIGYFRFNKEISYLINNNQIAVKYHKENNQVYFSINTQPLKLISDVQLKTNSISFSLANELMVFNYLTTSEKTLLLEQNDQSWSVIPNYHLNKNSANKKLHHANSNGNGSGIIAPIPGKIIEVNTQEGDYKNEGDNLLVLEAMKMENNILMPQSGVIKKVLTAQGNQVKANEILIEIDYNIDN